MTPKIAAGIRAPGTKDGATPRGDSPVEPIHSEDVLVLLALAFMLWLLLNPTARSPTDDATPLTVVDNPTDPWAVAGVILRDLLNSFLGLIRTEDRYGNPAAAIRPVQLYEVVQRSVPILPLLPGEELALWRHLAEAAERGPGAFQYEVDHYGRLVNQWGNLELAQNTLIGDFVRPSLTA